MEKTEVEMTALRSEIHTLQGKLNGATAWQRDPIWRKALLEKLLLMEGFSSTQVFDIMVRMKREIKR